MLRRLPTAQLLALIALVVALLGGGAAIAAAVGGNDATPAPKPLARAIHDALTAPAVQGITARITFTNHLVSSSSIDGAGPLLTGATGRLWAAPDGRFRLELQSDNGDAQITSDGHTLTVVDATQHQAYQVQLPNGGGQGSGSGSAPTVASIQRTLGRVMGQADLSGAQPTNVAGREAYTVRISPKHDGGLIGAAELAWDAANGTPLRVAVYAAGNPSPVLQLEATSISFGQVPASDLSVPIPAGTKVTTLDLRGVAAHHLNGAAQAAHQPAGNDPAAVASHLSFTLSAPDQLVGLSRNTVRLVGTGNERGALVTYGAGLGGIAVLERPAPTGGGNGNGILDRLNLPQVSINGATGQELATPLGTIVHFTRGGVGYTVIGSVPPTAAEAAARAL